MLRKSNRPYTDRTPRVRWQGALSRFKAGSVDWPLSYEPASAEETGDRVRWKGALSRFNARAIDWPLSYAPVSAEESGDLEAALVSAGVEDITISDILEAHDRWQEENPDDPNGVHDFVDKTWADKRAKKVDVG